MLHPIFLFSSERQRLNASRWNIEVFIVEEKKTRARKSIIRRVYERSIR